MEILFGIDVGTTNVKNIAFTANGEIAAQAAFPTPTLITAEGIHAVDADLLWKKLAESFSSVLAALKKSIGEARFSLSGIAVTGMAETGVLLGKNDELLYPAILWNDLCTAGMREIWNGEFGAKKTLDITGQFCQHNYSASRLLWLERKFPKILSNAKKWLCMPDFIAYKLTGEKVTDFSLAGRTMLMDINIPGWSEEICDYVGVDKSILPEIKPSGTFVGKLSAEAMRQTGLPDEVGVYVGGHDHICAAFACGITDNGTALDSSGTSELFFTVCSPSKIKSLTSVGFNSGIYAHPGKRYVAGALGSSGKVADWFKSITNGGNGSFDMSSEGIIFRPYLDGGPSPERNTLLTGGFSGLRSTHTYENLLQAVYEGLCFEAKKILFTLSEKPEKIIQVGGGSKNEIWGQIKSDVFNLPLTIPKTTEAAALGAAVFAGIGCGIYKDQSDALSATFRVDRVISPRSPEKYIELYRRYFEERTEK